MAITTQNLDQISNLFQKLRDAHDKQLAAVNDMASKDSDLAKAQAARDAANQQVQQSSQAADQSETDFETFVSSLRSSAAAGGTAASPSAAVAAGAGTSTTSTVLPPAADTNTAGVSLPAATNTAGAAAKGTVHVGSTPLPSGLQVTSGFIADMNGRAVYTFDGDPSAVNTSAWPQVNDPAGNPVSINGSKLYRYYLDTPGQVQGDGAENNTWHVVRP